MAKRKPCRISGKRKFKTHERALIRAGQILEKSQRIVPLSAYRCPHCSHFHLTRSH
jgi:hypothetical protein